MDSTDYESVNRSFAQLAHLAQTGPLWDKTVDDQGNIVNLKGLDRFFAWFMQTDESALWNISAKLISKVPTERNTITQRLRDKGFTKKEIAAKNWKEQARIFAEVIKHTYYSSRLDQAARHLRTLEGRVSHYQSPTETEGVIQNIQQLIAGMPQDVPEALRERAVKVNTVATQTLTFIRKLSESEKNLKAVLDRIDPHAKPESIGTALAEVERRIADARDDLQTIGEQSMRVAAQEHIDELLRKVTGAKQDLAAIQQLQDAYTPMLQADPQQVDTLRQNIEQAQRGLEDLQSEFITMSEPLRRRIGSELQDKIQAAQQVLATKWEVRIGTIGEIGNLADRLRTCNKELLLMEGGRAALGAGYEAVKAQLTTLQETTQRATRQLAQDIRAEAERQVAQMKALTSAEQLDHNSQQIATMRSQFRTLREAVQHLPFDQRAGVLADIEKADHALQAAAIGVQRCAVENTVRQVVAEKTIESAVDDLQKTAGRWGRSIGDLRKLRKEAEKLPKSVRAESLASLDQLEQQIHVRKTALHAMPPLQQAIAKSRSDLRRLQPKLESGAFCGALTSSLLSLDAARKLHATVPGEGTTLKTQAGEALESWEKQAFAKAHEHLVQLTQNLGARSSRDLNAQLGQLSTLQKGLARLEKEFPAYAEGLGKVQQEVTTTRARLVKQLQEVVTQALADESTLVVRATQRVAFHALDVDLTSELEAFETAQKELEHLKKLAGDYHLNTSKTFNDLPEQLKVRQIATQAESWVRDLDNPLSTADLTSLTSRAGALGRLLSRHQRKLKNLSSDHYNQLVAKYNAISKAIEERRVQIQEAQFQTFVTSPEGIAMQAWLPQLVATAAYRAPSRVDESRLPKRERPKHSRAERRQRKDQVAGLRARQAQTPQVRKAGRRK